MYTYVYMVTKQTGITYPKMCNVATRDAAVPTCAVPTCRGSTTELNLAVSDQKLPSIRTTRGKSTMAKLLA